MAQTPREALRAAIDALEARYERISESASTFQDDMVPWFSSNVHSLSSAERNALDLAASLEAITSAVRYEASSYNAFRCRQENTLRPAVSLPNELLELIFCFAILGCDFDRPDTFPVSDEHARSSVLGTCHRWREVAARVVKLWNHIQPRWRRSNNGCDGPHMRLQLQRSGGPDAALYMSARSASFEEDPKLTETAYFTRLHLKRIVSLDIHDSDRYKINLSGLQGSVYPALRYLRLRFGFGSRKDVLLGALPSLTHLELKWQQGREEGGAQLDLAASCSLVELRLDGPFDGESVLRALRCNGAQLRGFVWRAFDYGQGEKHYWDPALSTCPRFTLSSLQALHLEDNNSLVVLHKAVIPNLTDLALRLCGHRVARRRLDLDTIFAEKIRFPKLRRLKWLSITEGNFHDVLSAHPGIEELTVDLGWVKGFFSPPNLTLHSEEDSAAPLPRLRALIHDHDTYCSTRFDGDLLVELVSFSASRKVPFKVSIEDEGFYGFSNDSEWTPEKSEKEYPGLVSYRKYR